MKFTSDSTLLSSGEGSELARRLVEDDSLEATELSLTSGNFNMKFEELRSGFSMLYRTDDASEHPFVALDTYDRPRVIALIELFAENPESAIASIEWQQDSDTGALGYIVMAIAIAFALLAFYGLYIEFFE